MKYIVAIAVLVSLLLVGACLPAKPVPTTDTGELPEIDDIGISAGIEDAVGALDDGTDTEPTDTKPAETKPAETKPAETKPAETKPTETKPAETKPTTTTKPAETTTAPADGAIRKTVTEGELVSFPNLKAVDPDGDKITYTFTTPLTEKGTWQTKVGDAGEYPVTVTASDGKTTATQKVLIVVLQANKPPVIAGLANISANEGDTLDLKQTITDPEGKTVSITYSGWMTAATKKLSYDDAGSYDVVVKASDGETTVQKTIKVVVENVNRAPVLTDLSEVKVVEGDKVTVVASTSDADGDKVTVTYGKPLDASGVWQTKVGDAGSITANVSASDGTDKVMKTVMITVAKKNGAPVINSFSDITVDEGDTVKLSPKITDPDGDKVVLIYTGWMSEATKTTGSADSGVYDVTLTVTDTAGNTVKKTIKVTVNDVNRAPTFDPNAFS